MKRIINVTFIIIIISIFSFYFAISNATEKQIDSKAADIKPIEIRFSKFWPFPGNMINYSLSDQRKVMTISGNYSKTFGLTAPRTIDLKGNNILQIEVIDTGNSVFREDETNRGAGDGKMLKVIIDKDQSGNYFTLICEDEMMHLNDPEFILKESGKFIYKLNQVTGGKLYKIGFVFYNANLDGFKIKAKLLHK